MKTQNYPVAYYEQLLTEVNQKLFKWPHSRKLNRKKVEYEQIIADMLTSLE